MSNLLITIIAIALVAIAALAAIFYGGGAFNEGQNKAKAVTLINQREQIKAASSLYQARQGGVPVSSIEELKAQNYLSVDPTLDNASWHIEGGVVVIPLAGMDDAEAEDICQKAWEEAGNTGTVEIPPCGETTSEHICCSKE